MSRIPIVRLIHFVGATIYFILLLVFYYIPLWMMGSRWCEVCRGRIKRNEYCGERKFTVAEVVYLCRECEEEWKK